MDGVEGVDGRNQELQYKEKRPQYEKNSAPD
jgi:hypothetical protein